ncbi:MAG: hypothetical protein ACI83Q_000778 [Colwellia polaris]|jgi:hypothetical protein
MKIEITPTQQPEKLRDNLEKTADRIELGEDKIKVEVEKEETVAKTPGIEKYTVEGEEKQGLKGRPVQEKAYAELETREDAVKALLATINGYNLVILNSGRDWDLRQLRKYNPAIIELKNNEPKEELGIEKALFESENTEKVEVPMEEVEIPVVYREMMT